MRVHVWRSVKIDSMKSNAKLDSCWLNSFCLNKFVKIENVQIDLVAISSNIFIWYSSLLVMGVGSINRRSPMRLLIRYHKTHTLESTKSFLTQYSTYAENSIRTLISSCDSYGSVLSYSKLSVIISCISFCRSQPLPTKNSMILTATAFKFGAMLLFL